MEASFNKKFYQFDKDNPKVWELFVRFTFELIAKGRQRYSARGVFHRIRWETALTTSDQLYKLNNNWSPCYARKFHTIYPEYEGFFSLRISRADEEIEDEDMDLDCTGGPDVDAAGSDHGVGAGSHTG